jgi:hypothetical protein
MRGSEVRAAGEAAARAFGGAVDHVQGTHRAIARRVFGRADGDRELSVAWAHDAISDGVYAAVRGVGGTVVRGAAELATASRRPEAPGIADLPVGDALLGALNGAFGDRFAAEDSALELRMTLRHRGRDLPVEPAELRRAFPLPSGRVALLVHGLCLTDASWSAPEGRVAYAERLHRELGFDVVALRYNTGRRIPANGAQLAGLLAQLAAAWPGGIRELVLIGHSMGGLVCRSACVVGAEAGHDWVGALRHTVSLGTPHLGANLERAAASAAWAVGLLPETRALGDLLGLRSDGVLDLRHGAIVPDDGPLEGDRWPWVERGTAVPLLEGVAHHTVAATVAADPDSWLARTVLGDLLVTPASAVARARGDRRLGFRDEDVVVLGGMDHFDLQHDPRVWERLRGWLGAAPALPAAGETG